MEIECDFCHDMFVKGTGHMCWCSECSKPHPMCDECYISCKKTGDIIDSNIPRKSITSKNKQKYT